MKTSTLLLVVNATLAVLVAVPVMSAIRGPESQAGSGWAVQEQAGRAPDHLVLADDDEGGHDGWLWWGLSDDDHRHGYHRDGDHDDDGEDDDDDDGAGRAAGADPASAGSVAPPANGLFGNGAPPRAQVN